MANTLPPAGQSIPPDLLDRLRKRIGELTVNVQVLPQIVTAENGGQFIELVISRATGVASTCDGRYFIRISDTCQPVLGDDVLRLANERPGLPWESMDSRVSRNEADAAKLANFMAAIRASDRVKDSVKEKSADELLTHYALAEGADADAFGCAAAGHGQPAAQFGHRSVGTGHQIR